MTEPRSRRRPLGAALVAAGLVVLIFGAAWVVASLLPPQRRNALIERQLSLRLRREVRFQRVDLRLWPPVRLEVPGLQVAEAGGLANGALLKATKLDVDLDVFALLRHRVVVRRLALIEPALHLVLREDGTTNLDDLAASPKDSAQAARAMDLAVRELVIRDGHVLVDDLRARRRIAFDLGTRTSLDLRGGKRFETRGETVVQGVARGPLGATRIDQLDRSLAGLRWRIDHDGVFDGATNRLDLKQLALRFGGTRVSLAGTVLEPGLHPRVDLRARGEGVDVGEMLGFLSRADARLLHGIRGDGALDFDLAVRGAVDPAAAASAARLPDVTGSVRLANAWVQYPGAPARIDGLGFTARLGRDSLTIPNLVARVGGQPLRAALRATRFADPLVAFAVSGDLDLGAIAPLIVSGGALSGRAAVDVRGNGRARDAAGMAIDGRAKLSNVAYRDPKLPKPWEDVNGTLTFSQDRASAAGLGARAGGSRVVLDARIQRPLALIVTPGKPAPEPARIDFAVRSGQLDLAEVMPQGGGPIVLPNARGQGRVGIAKFKNQKLQLDDLRALIDLEPGVVSVSKFSGRAYEGLVTGNARLELPDPTHPRITTHARLDSAHVERLLGAWVPPGDWIRGGLSTSIDLDANLQDLRQSLTAAGLATVWNGQLAGIPFLERIATLARVPPFKAPHFDELKSSFKIVRGRVFTGPATLHGPQGDWLFLGSVGLDGTLDYNVSVTVPPALVQRLGAHAAAAAGALADPQGRVLMDFRVTGPARAPKVVWDPSAMKARAAGRVTELIEQRQQQLENTVRDSLHAQARAVEDSARAVAERYRRAVEDSLKRRARDVFKGFFPKTPKDTAAKDTAK